MRQAVAADGGSVAATLHKPACTSAHAQASCTIAACLVANLTSEVNHMTVTCEATAISLNLPAKPANVTVAATVDAPVADATVATAAQSAAAKAAATTTNCGCCYRDNSYPCHCHCDRSCRQRAPSRSSSGHSGGRNRHRISEANAVRTEIEEGVVLREEDVSKNPQRTGGRRHVHWHHAESARRLPKELHPQHILCGREVEGASVDAESECWQ
mmetsp:Transcript_8793/g.20531  ORF Transcript_8793/g.20531 Transcript_8793/m.20531 type:complete len:214 (+) Transcript_8793:510-1151(+)